MSETVTEKPKHVLSDATRLLFLVASKSPVLRSIMSIELTNEGKPRVLPVGRHWLVKHPVRENEFHFEPDLFRKHARNFSTGEELMILWLLNVWNPSHAKQKRWTFSLFDAMGTLDGENINCICDWMANPIWP